MKKIMALCLAIMLITLTLGTQVFAAAKAQDSGLDSGIVISTEGGKEIELFGHIEPTIISVTMPSYIPFDISRSVANVNKAVSPKITVQNNSTVPVTVAVDRARVDLKQLPGITWSNNGQVSDTQIAVGFTEAQEQPTGLENAKWLADGFQDTMLLNLSAESNGTMFIVGTLGKSVPENRTFSVIPTLVVRAAV